MKQEMLMRKFIDYILLNAYSVNSTGLYNGKAGLSLCLFEMSRLLNDEYIEEQAFNLLQESLLSKNRDISFENGLSGIGYVLLYLLKNRLVEADFDDLFEENQKRIFNQLKELEKKDAKEKKLQLIKIVYFLQTIAANTKNMEAFLAIQSFSVQTSFILEEQFLGIGNKKVSCPTAETLRVLDVYLKVADENPDFIPSRSLLYLYSELYKNGRLGSYLSVGHHLYNIAKKLDDSDLNDIARKNIEIGVQNIIPDSMTLSQRIDLLYLLSKIDSDLYQNLIRDIEEELFESEHSSEMEKRILQCIDPFDFIPGYQSGIARFMLYWVYKASSGKSSLLFL